MTDRYRNPGAIVSPAELESTLDDPSLRIFECTTWLDPPAAGAQAPYTVRSGRADYDAGHVPGAAFVDLQADLSDNTSAEHLRFTMPAADELATRLGRLGVGDGHRVVLYARGSMQWATRVWWMLHAIGFDRAAVLDGGWERWTAERRATGTAAVTYPPAPAPAVRARPGAFAGRDAVRAAIGDAAVCTINALAPDLHRGENPRYGRPGRIPGSVNVPAATLQAADDKRFPAPATAASAFAAAGLRPDQRVIVYCGGGIAATLDAFVLTQLGYRDVAVYDASMSEWARDASLPIETG